VALPAVRVLLPGGRGYTSTCASQTLDSVEALLDVAHPDIWVHV